ncbi:MAG: hypothetical protein ACFCUR_08895 [Rhodomicrobiaceae bacterium]
MFRGMESKSAVAGLAILAACAIGGPASAADLGGDCCADLEERVAELEATTARKGNRVVSLSISGVVHESLLFWDDGGESDAYIVTNAGYQSRLKFNGEAQINPNLKAGYEIELGLWNSPSLTVDQTSSENVSSSSLTQQGSVIIRQNKLYIQSNTLGRLTIGRQSVAADNISSINVSGAVHIANAPHQVYMGTFKARQTDGDLSPLRFNAMMGGDGSNLPGDTDRLESIRYDAQFGGFTASASWGEDDYWDVALRWQGLLFGRMKAAGGVAYSVWNETWQDNLSISSTTGKNGCLPGVTPTGDPGEADCEQIGLSGSIMDVPTGLYVYGAYGINWDNNVNQYSSIKLSPAVPDGFGFEFAGPNPDDEDSFWYIQAGIEKNWTGYGATTIFGEYGNYDTGFNVSFTGSATDPAFTTFDSANVKMWGFGINQNFASAALDIYAKFSHYDASAENVRTFSEATPTGAANSGDFEDFYTIYTGARIQF